MFVIFQEPGICLDANRANQRHATGLALCKLLAE